MGSVSSLMGDPSNNVVTQMGPKLELPSAHIRLR